MAILEPRPSHQHEAQMEPSQADKLAAAERMMEQGRRDIKAGEALLAQGMKAKLEAEGKKQAV